MKALALAILLASTIAHADNKASAKAHVELADRDFKLGKFEEALVEYTKAYELFPVPALLFNIGQCHKNLKNWERAVFFYEGYLRDAPADATNRGVVEDLIRESKAERDKQSAEQLAERRAIEDAREKAAIEAARVQAEAEAKRRADEDRRVAEARRQNELDAKLAHDRDDKFYRKWWFWTAVGGAACAIGGTAYYFSGDSSTVLPHGSLGSLDFR